MLFRRFGPVTNGCEVAGGRSWQHGNVQRARPLTTVVVLVGILVGGGIYWLFFRGPSSADCAPVRELLSFNKTQVDAMNAKTTVPEPGSGQVATEPSDLEYRAWADGLTDRAAKVTADDLAQQARDVAQTANRLVQAKLDYNAQSAHTAPGGPTPPAAMAVAAFNEELETRVSLLAQKCPG
jgi:hypothetical protein